MDMSQFGCLVPPNFTQLIDQWMMEDTPSFDYGGYIVGDEEREAQIWMKSCGVLAGIPFAEEILSRFGCEVEWQMVEGGWVDVEEGGKVEVGVVRGPARKILMGERMVLNLISRCSGVASKTRNAVTIASKVPQFSGRIAGTRKTTPGFRLVEKYGLLVGGASSHRFDLSQSLMIKDNHIDASGGIREAIRRGKEVVPHTIKIEVECRSLEDAMEACEEGVDIVMLDNFPPDLCLQSALTIKEEYPHVVVEVSGGIDEENVGDYLGEGVDIVMTHSYQPVDFSMKIKKLTP